MEHRGSVVAVFTEHKAAETAVKALAAADFNIKDLTIVGKGYKTEETVVGFYSTGDRMKFWGTQGAVWGGLWGLFFGGLFLTVPAVGGVVVLGALATIIISALENALVVGGLGMLGAGLYGLGIPKDSIINYETAIKADGFLVMAHGDAAELSRAKAILAKTNPASIDVHSGPLSVAQSDVRAAG